MKFIHLLLMLVISVSARSFAREDCGDHLIQPKYRLVFSKIYPDNLEAAHSKHLQFGFESEYVTKEAGPLLKSYMPDPLFFAIRESDWRALSDEERLDFVLNNATSLFPNYRKPGRLKKIASDPELYASLPDSIVYDSGNFEIVLPPYDRVEDFAHKIKTINTQLGTGSMQITVSSPRESFFQFKGRASFPATAIEDLHPDFMENSYRANLGYYSFFNDFDLLEKMQNGFARYQQDPSQLTGKSFAHPWLGPMNKDRYKKLDDLLRKHAAGEDADASKLQQMAIQIDSHKFISGTVYRPDVAWKYNRLASEVRDCHKNPACLEDRLKREVLFHMVGKEKLIKASFLKPFDRNAAFNSLPRNVQKMLQDAFPKYGHYHIDSTEVYRNFAWPLRDWGSHIDLLGDSQLAKKVDLAQKRYLEVLEVSAREYAQGTKTIKELQPLLQGEINRFGVESGLVESFKAYYEDLIKDHKTLVEFIKLTLFYSFIQDEMYA
jgi:hypothetical protein